MSNFSDRGEAGQGNSRGRDSGHGNYHDSFQKQQERNNGGAGCGQNRNNKPRGQRGGGFGSPHKQNRKFQQGYMGNQHDFRNQSSPDQHQYAYYDGTQHYFYPPPPNYPVPYGRGNQRYHSWNRGNGSRDRSNSHGRRNDISPSLNQERDRSQSRERYNSQGWRWDEDPLVMLSKTLSSILRHNAANFDLKLMKGGFLYVDEILRKAKKLHGFTLEDVKHVVKSNDKQRFTLEQDENNRWKIRANQGHTIEVEDLDLKPITNADDFPVVIHGTYMESWEVIKNTGLSRMKRNHIHFAPGEPGENGVISGMRSSCQVMIYLDLKKALEDGLKFFLSSNNVILSPGDKDGTIHPRYFAGAVDRWNNYKLNFNPNIATKTEIAQGSSDEKKGKKKQKKRRKKTNKDSSQSDGPSTDDSLVHPSKMPTLADESDSSIIFETPTETPKENVKEEQSKPAEASAVVEDTGVLSELKDAYADKDDEDEEQPDIETVLISDVDVAKCTVLDLIRDEPQFVVVIGLGDNLGSAESHMKELVIGANSSLYVFSLEDKSMMEKGRLKELLLHKNITKVFCRIGEVSPSLIHEHNIVMNGVPIWDLEILYFKQQGHLSDIDKETLKEMDFQKNLFKKWAKGNQRSGNDPEDLDDLKQQAVIMFKMFPIFGKRLSSDEGKKMKKEVFEQAMQRQDETLTKKIEELKVAQKETVKKEKTEGKTESQSPGNKKSGKVKEKNKRKK